MELDGCWQEGGGDLLVEGCRQETEVSGWVGAQRPLQPLVRSLNLARSPLRRTSLRFYLV